MFASFLWLMLYLSVPATAQDSGGTPLLKDRLVGWQTGSDFRGTWDVTISCLATILACTWSVQHLNVPGGRRDGKWSRWFRSVKWMIITILFPELIVIHAIIEFNMALRALRRMEERGKYVERPWWLQQPFLPTLVKQLSYLLRSLSCFKKQNGAEPINDPKWTLTHCYFANMGGLYFEERNGQVFPLTALQLAEEPGFESPQLTEEEIDDKSKQDWFAKLIAALGFLQLVLSLIVRTSQGLAFSQLETITLGFAVCGTVVYLSYLYKPQRVETWISIKDQNIRFKKTYDSFWDILVNESADASTKTRDPSDEVPYRIPNDNIMISESRIAHSAVPLLAFASGLFGAMHAIAWHFEFPSAVEKILWQTATVVAAGSPVAGLVTILFAQWTVAMGDPQLFAGKCLRLLREYSWYVEADELLEIQQISHALESGLAGLNAPQTYASIFHTAVDDSGSRLVSSLLGFLECRGRFSNMEPGQKSDLHGDDEFIDHFRFLDRVLKGEGPKKLVDTATTDVFPRKSMFPPAFNSGVLYMTSLLYILSRVSLLAIGFSSLRRMPESVYISTPWTEYVPTLGSNG